MTRFHDGTPAKAVTFRCTVSRQIASTFFSKSGINAVSAPGTRMPLARRGVCSMRMADRSPSSAPPPVFSKRWLPPSVRVLPEKTRLCG